MGHLLQSTNKLHIKYPQNNINNVNTNSQTQIITSEIFIT